MALALAVALTSGCGALHPIKGLPASYLPVEFMGPSRDGLRPINPMLLTRSRPAEHYVDAGDVLTVFIPGVLGPVSTDLHTIGESPPINYPQDPEMPPTIGFPVTVRGDGTISLPQVAPISVRGMTLARAEDAVRQAYLSPKQILPPGKERVLVSLQRPREYRVLVVREDSGFTTDSSGFGTINLGHSRRGTARIVSLKAYENDVLHALARGQGADGLPGLDAEGAVYVIRRRSHAASSCGEGHGSTLPSGTPHGSLPQSGPFYSAPHVAPHGDTVIRFQSPGGDYRSRGSAGYTGHSFAGAPPAPQSASRYGTPPRVSPNPPAMSPVANAAPYAAPPMAPGGRYGTGPHITPVGPGVPQPAIAPVQWTTVPQQTAPTTSGRYAGQPFPATSPASVTVPNAGRAYPAASPMPQPHFMPQNGLPAGYPSTMHAPPAAVSPMDHQSFPPAFAGQPIPNQPLPGPHFADPHFAGPGITGPAFTGPLPGETPHGDYFHSMLSSGLTGTIDDPNVIRIPIRVQPGERPQIRETDVTLEDGDIVFIEARDSEVFYTGGLLGGGQYTLPRDHDLRALEAISIAQAQGSQGGSSRSAGGVSALNQDVTISASKLIVVRKLANGTTVPIEVDLNRAKQDMTGRENIIIQPGDFLYLQYSCLEAVGAFFERHLLEGALFGVAASQFSNGN